MELPLRGLAIAALTLVITLYGSYSLLTEVIRTILPFGILLTTALVGAIYFLRVPAPSLELVEAIVGKEPHLVLDDSYVMKTVAHRGAGLDAPENTIEAFKMCNEKGCDAIEFDVSLTKDDVPIVFHDSTLERLTDLNFVIGDSNWSDLSGVDISVKHIFKDRFIKTNIPTLDQTVTQLLGSGQRMFIDLKDNNTKIRKGDPKIVCSMAWRPGAFAYSSYNYPEGEGDKRATSWYKHFMLKIVDCIHEWALTRVTYYFLGLSIILLHKDAIDSRAVLQWRRKGVRVMAWTVNTPTEKQYFARFLKITYLTDTLTGEGTTHAAIV